MKCNSYSLVLSCMMYALTVSATYAAAENSKDEQAIKEVLARFYEGWNAHDANKMVSIYAEDVDHINTYAQWHKGKSVIKGDIERIHAGSAKNSHKTHTIEKIKFIEPDVAVIRTKPSR